MERVQLIHWHAEEATERAERLISAGFAVAYGVPDGVAFLRALRRDPPDAVVIDLSRLPAQGRDIAVLLRKYKDTRSVPLVFVDGQASKVLRIRGILPDAVYTSWADIGPALREAIDHPPADPVVLQSLFDVYAGKSLVEKLGIRQGMAVGLVGAPTDFVEVLGVLPEGAVLREQVDDGPDLTVWFVRSRDELERAIGRMAERIGKGALWIAWPKKAGRMASDLSQQQVRETGLAAGLVDYRICSIDAVWSGLLFRCRKSEARD